MGCEEEEEGPVLEPPEAARPREGQIAEVQTLVSCRRIMGRKGEGEVLGG